MNDWLKNNGFSIAIALAGIIVTYTANTALYGYRLSAIENVQNTQGASITALQNSANDLRVSVAQIQTSLEYIKAKLDRLAP